MFVKVTRSRLSYLGVQLKAALILIHTRLQPGDYKPSSLSHLTVSTVLLSVPSIPALHRDTATRKTVETVARACCCSRHPAEAVCECDGSLTFNCAQVYPLSPSSGVIVRCS